MRTLMMTSSNGNIFRVTGHLYGEFTGPGDVPTQRPVTRSLMFSLICVWINGWINNREAGDLRRYRGHYDVSVMLASWYGKAFRIVALPALCQENPPVTGEYNYPPFAFFINVKWNEVLIRLIAGDLIIWAQWWGSVSCACVCVCVYEKISPVIKFTCCKRLTCLKRFRHKWFWYLWFRQHRFRQHRFRQHWLRYLRLLFRRRA